jgi:hypothetical protein
LDLSPMPRRIDEEWKSRKVKDDYPDLEEELNSCERWKQDGDRGLR